MSPVIKTLLQITGALLAPVALAGSSAADNRAGFSERLDLVAVEIELVVTDRKGRPVTDLEPADLELYRDGARQEILYLDRSSSQGSAPRQIVVYADHLRISPARRDALLRRLDGFVEERIARGGLVSVVAFDGSVELLAVDSRDAGNVRAAIEALASRPAAPATNEARRLRHALAGGVGASLLRPVIERYVERQRQDVARSLAGLAATIRALARPAGSVAILYLSDGIPAWPGAELSGSAARTAATRVRVVRTGGAPDGPTAQGVPTPAVQYLVSLPGSRPEPWLPAEAGGTAELLEPLIRIAGAHGAAFYPVRPSALLHPPLGDSRARGGADHVAPLKRLARSTGGHLLSYGRFEAALGELSQRLDSAYALGFQVSPGSERTTHSLEVKVARRGWKAHHRRTISLE